MNQKINAIKLNRASAFFRRNLIDEYTPISSVFIEENNIKIEVMHRNKKRKIKFIYDENNTPINAELNDKLLIVVK